MAWIHLRGRLGAAITGLLRLLAYAYLLRFPILTGAAVVGLVAAAFSIARPLLANLFDVHERFGLLALSFTAFVTAWVIMVASRLVLLYGAVRFQLEPYVEPYEIGPNLRWWHLLPFGVLIALPIVGGAIWYTATRNGIGIGWLIMQAAIGGALSLLLLLALAFFQTSVAPPERARKPSYEAKTRDDDPEALHDIFFPSDTPLASQVIEKAREKHNLRGLHEWIVNLAQNLPEKFGGGYFEYERGRPVYVLPGQGAAAVVFILFVLFYVFVGVIGYWRLDSPPIFPTLGYVLLLLMLMCWGLSGLAFFLDRFRVPVIVPLLLWLWITSLAPWSDFYFDVTDRGSVSTATTPAVSENDEAIVVIAANGGGIQAAAWTARVLTGLQQEIGDVFGKSIRLISAVSGGSVAAMYFANEYSAGKPPCGSELQRIVQRAEESSLDKIASGTVYPDFLRVVTSFGFGSGRGQALERSWLRRHLVWKNRDGVQAPLSYWRADEAAGRRPALIFNATLAETGERLPLPTVELPSDLEGAQTRQRFYDILSGKDVAVLTATRLSAAFPYVSPAARPNTDGEPAHIVDGGYYDNYGTASVVEWLNGRLSRTGSKVKKVLIVQIHGMPTAKIATQAPRARQTEDIKSRGWFFQAFAPIKTLLAVRETGQLSHGKVELNLLRAFWRTQGVDVQTVVFEFCARGEAPYCRDKPPLSWHLNQREKEAIEQSWRDEAPGGPNSGLSAVRAFFGPASAPRGQCMNE